MKKTGSVALLGLMLLGCLSDIAAAQLRLFNNAAGRVQFSCDAYRMSGGMVVACPRNYEPVCGTDEVTYSNECSLCNENYRNRDVTKKHDGQCVSQVDCTGYVRSASGVSTPCTMEYTPICGTDGVTYSNKCQFCSAVANGLSLNVRHQGTCSQSSSSQEIDCSEFSLSNLVCPLSFDPLCASDGKTYGNQCQFCEAFTRSRGTLSLQHRGQC
ncbi:double-headed protease inhibitor, submandibular gland-like [Melanerpes formicivorus]|uniref:double-headed protease inhibitor, submandibular gland-like n=1 Tax=Melanerpes formicivorus TaxID=211600 RepID=UPI00358DE131